MKDERERARERKRRRKDERVSKRVGKDERVRENGKTREREYHGNVMVELN